MKWQNLLIESSKRKAEYTFIVNWRGNGWSKKDGYKITKLKLKENNELLTNWILKVTLGFKLLMCHSYQQARARFPWNQNECTCLLMLKSSLTQTSKSYFTKGQLKNELKRSLKNRFTLWPKYKMRTIRDVENKHTKRCVSKFVYWRNDHLFDKLTLLLCLFTG